MSERTCGQCGVTLGDGPGVHACEVRTYRCEVCGEDHRREELATCYVKDMRRVGELERRLDALANRLDMLSAKVERSLERLRSVVPERTFNEIVKDIGDTEHRTGDDRDTLAGSSKAIRAIWGKPSVEEQMDAAAEMLERARATLRESGILHGSSVLYDLGCVIQALNELRARRLGRA